MLANRLALLAAVPIFITLTVAAILAFRFASTEQAEQGWVRHTYEVQNVVRDVRGDAERAEANQRGYLLTQDAHYRDAFGASVAAFGADLQSLQDLTKDNPSQQIRVAKIRETAIARFDRLAQSMSAATRTPPSPEFASTLALERESMESLQAQMGAALGEEYWLLHKRTSATEATARETITTTVFGGLVALALLIAAAFLLVKNNVDLAKSEAERAHQANVLQATLDSMRDGIAVFETDGSLAAFNQNFFRLLDFPTTLARAGAQLASFAP